MIERRPRVRREQWRRVKVLFSDERAPPALLKVNGAMYRHELYQPLAKMHRLQSSLEDRIQSALPSPWHRRWFARHIDLDDEFHRQVLRLLLSYLYHNLWMNGFRLSPQVWNREVGRSLEGLDHYSPLSPPSQLERLDDYTRDGMS